jgi:hypothetical protein
MNTKLNDEELAAQWPIKFQRDAYAAAIRKVAQPIADERDELREALEGLAERIDGYSYDDDLPTGTASALGRIADDARAVLAKYPKP